MRASGALVVCAEMWKFPREEALDERDIFACRALFECIRVKRRSRGGWARPLAVFSDSNVGWLGLGVLGLHGRLVGR